jgi:hypothetical protein
MANSELFKFVAALVDELATVREEQARGTFLLGAVNDLGRNDSFPGAGWRLEYLALMAISEPSPKIHLRLRLVSA